MKTPLLPRILFVFVVVSIISLLSLIIYSGVLLVQLGPEGIGAEFGQFVKGFNEASGAETADAK